MAFLVAPPLFAFPYLDGVTVGAEELKFFLRLDAFDDSHVKRPPTSKPMSARLPSAVNVVDLECARIRESASITFDSEKSECRRTITISILFPVGRKLLGIAPLPSFADRRHLHFVLSIVAALYLSTGEILYSCHQDSNSIGRRR